MTRTIECGADFSEIGGNIARGSTVVFPTDTIYGIGTSPLSETGVRKCFDIKKRQVEKKLPVLFSNFNEAAKMVIFDARARSLAQRFWPGQLTLILPLCNIGLPEDLVGEEKTLAVRVPNHECCLRLISQCGNSLIGTSANLSGSLPFHDPEDVALQEFAAAADYFVKGKCGESNKPSTIIDLSEDFAVVREGAVPVQEVIDYLRNTSNTDFSFSAVTS